MVMHPALQYAAVGYHLIPLARGAKSPSPLLPGLKWGQFQAEAADSGTIEGWLQGDPEINLGLVCGNGLACGDCDDLRAAEWVLADPHRALFQGAAIVRSGHGKAHIWFQYAGDLPSTTWRMVPGRKMGEIRSTGNYVVVPPSRLNDGGVYTLVAGSLGRLPTIDDPTVFLESIVKAYLQERPDNTPPPDRTSKRILGYTAAEASAVASRIRTEKFKKKITDTLFVKGYQGPGSPHWPGVDSDSEIDFAVVCEFIRKGWDFYDVELVFASTLVGDGCYKDTARPNHGQGYLFKTWENAQDRLRADALAAKSPQGSNFKVARASRVMRDKDAQYTLVLEEPSGAQHVVTLDSATLSEQRAFIKTCFATDGFVPEFASSMAGNAFMGFAGAVHKLSDADVSQALHGMTEASRLQGHVLEVLGNLPDRGMPSTQAETRGVGWRIERECWIRPRRLLGQLENARYAPKIDAVHQTLRTLGGETAFWNWPDGGPETLIHLVLPAF